MSLGGIFDTIVETLGNSDGGVLGRAINPNYDNFVKGAEERNRKRALIEQSQRIRESNSSSGSSGGGVGTLLLGAAFIGALALLGGSGDKNTNPNAK